MDDLTVLARPAINELDIDPTPVAMDKIIGTLLVYNFPMQGNMAFSLDWRSKNASPQIHMNKNSFSINLYRNYMLFKLKPLIKRIFRIPSIWLPAKASQIPKEGSYFRIHYHNQDSA